MDGCMEWHLQLLRKVDCAHRTGHVRVILQHCRGCQAQRIAGSAGAGHELKSTPPARDDVC